MGVPFLDYIIHSAYTLNIIFHKVANRSKSLYVAPPRIFRLLLKGNFDVYSILPFGKKLIFAIVDPGLFFATLQLVCVILMNASSIDTYFNKVLISIGFCKV